MRGISIVIIACLLASLGWAGDGKADDSRRAKIEAATANAVAALHDDLVQQPISPEMTIAQFLEKTAGDADFTQSLARAQQVGGPRWFGDEGCQVRLEITGKRVAQSLHDIALAQADKSPIPANALEQQLKDFSQRTYSATGASSDAISIEAARPPRNSPAWAGVTQEATRDAIIAARADASQHVIASIAPIELGEASAVGDVLKNPKIASAIVEWLNGRPVRSVEFRSDRQVEVTLGVKAEELFAVFRDISNEAKDVKLPADDAGWARVKNAFSEHMAATTGRALAVAPDVATTALLTASDFVPARPPRWAGDQIDAEGTAVRRETKLKTAAAARADAVDKLRSQLEALPLSDGVTLGSAAQHDEHVSQVISKALGQARVFKADYQSDGDVAVKVTLDLHDLWEDLSDEP